MYYKIEHSVASPIMCFLLDSKKWQAQTILGDLKILRLIHAQI